MQNSKPTVIRDHAYAVNFDADAEAFWQAFWPALNTDRTVPAELRALEEGDATEPMTRARWLEIAAWLATQPEGSIALRGGPIAPCENCDGRGKVVLGFACSCRRHSEECDYETATCPECEGRGFSF